MQGLEILQYKISPNPNPKSATNPRSPYCVMRFIVGYTVYMYTYMYNYRCLYPMIACIKICVILLMVSSFIFVVVLHAVISEWFPFLFTHWIHHCLLLTYTQHTPVYSAYSSALSILQYTQHISVYSAYSSVLSILQYTQHTPVYSAYSSILTC